MDSMELVEKRSMKKKRKLEVMVKIFPEEKHLWNSAMQVEKI